MSAELLSAARDWADADPHAGDRAEIEALIEAYGEGDPDDPVHNRVGGQYTLPEFDADNVTAPAPRADIAPGSGR